MDWITTGLALAAFGQTPAPVAVAAPAAPPTSYIVADAATPCLSGNCPTLGCDACGSARKPFESDHAFEHFIGPISSPIYSKDPRSLTEIRGLYINNQIPGSNPVLQGGHFNAIAAQIRVALTERLTFIADKDGYLFLRPGNAALGSRNGFLNLAAGLKYTFLRNPETQTLAAAGFMYEVPTGERDVFQNGGSGIVTPFLTFGQEFQGCWHVLANVAHSTALTRSQNSSFLYTQLHIDKGINGWLYPLLEVNYYHYTQSGRNLPLALGEGDGLVSFGTQGIAGKNLVTVAPGLKARLSKRLETGFVYELPITGRKDLIDGRFIGELILRY